MITKLNALSVRLTVETSPRTPNAYCQDELVSLPNPKEVEDLPHVVDNAFEMSPHGLARVVDVTAFKRLAYIDDKVNEPTDMTRYEL